MDRLSTCREHLLPDEGSVQSMWYNWSVGYSCSAVVSVAVTCKEEWSLNIKKSKSKTEPHWSHSLCFSFCIHSTSMFLKNAHFQLHLPPVIATDQLHQWQQFHWSFSRNCKTPFKNALHIWHWTITIHEIANNNSCVVSYLLLANKWILKFKFTEILSSSYFCG